MLMEKNPSSKILLTGATGWLGGAIAKKLGSEPDLAVLALARREPSERGPWEDFVSCDLSDRSSVEAVADRFKGVDTIIHAAGAPPLSGRSLGKGRRYAMDNVEATRGILRIAESSGIKRILFLSSTAVYDSKSLHRRLAQEHDRARPRCSFGGSKLKSEQLIRNSGLESMILRLAPVFGTGDRHNLVPLAKALARRSIILPKSTHSLKSLVPIPMVCEVIGLLIRKDWNSISSPILNVSLPSSVRLRSICDAFARECGFTRPWSCPNPVLRSIGLLGDFLSVFGIPSYPTNRKVSELARSTSICSNRLAELFPEYEWSNFASHLRGCRGYYKSVARNRT